MNDANRNTALASAFVDELGRCGVRNAVISPGSRSTPLALALWREAGIDVTVVVDERSAGFVALGAAHATGTPVAALCTSGTAAANLYPAVCEADESGIGLIALTADRPPELRAIGAGQTIDQLELYGKAVRWFCEVGIHEADDAGLVHYRSVACRAFALARGEPRAGPVHLNVAWREPLGDDPVPGEVTATSTLATEGRSEARPLTAVTPNWAAPGEFIVAELARHLDGAERPLIVAGRQPDSALAAPVTELAAAVGAPILAEPTSQLRFGSHDRTRVVDAYDAIARSRPVELAPDLVLRFGEMPTSKALRGWLASLDEMPQLVVDPTGAWNEPTRKAAAIIRADPIALASALKDRLANESGPSTEHQAPSTWSSRWLHTNRAAQNAITAELATLHELTEPGVHRTLAGAYADGDLVYTASSMPIRDQEAFAVGGNAGVLFLANRGANGIDGLVSSGIGAAIATGRPTWVLTGDLGLLHDLNALSLLRRATAPVRLVVFDNGGGGIFEFLPQSGQIARDEFEALFGTPSGLDCERAAALWSIPHRRLESADELTGATGRGTELVEVPTDRRRNVELHRRISTAAADAVARGLAG